MKNFTKCEAETEILAAVSKIGNNIDLTVNDFLNEKEKNLNMLQYYSNKCDSELNRLEDYQSSLHTKFTEIAAGASKDFEELMKNEQQKDKIFNEYFAHAGFKEDQVLKDHNETKQLKSQKAELESKLNLYEGREFYYESCSVEKSDIYIFFIKQTL